MTRQERLEALSDACMSAGVMTCDVECWHAYDDGEDIAKHDGTATGHHANVALDHLAALEQQAITAYLAEVPLPEGWREEYSAYGEWRYFQTLEGLGDEERVMAHGEGVRVWTNPAHWPAIPLPVLVRAAVQCHRLREAGCAKKEWQHDDRAAVAGL